MKHRHLWAALGRAVLAGAMAFGILTAFCALYYNIPAHRANPDGATDYKWEAHALYCRGTEGFARGRTNNDGFSNPFDYDGDLPIDILVMGSSEMEAFRVNMDESTAARLDARLPEDTVYNIGVSDHGFLTCAGNLGAALRTYRPRKYVIIETGSLSFPDAELEKALAGTLEERPSRAGGIAGLLQKNPFLRLTYRQVRGFLRAEEPGAAPAAAGGANDERLLDGLLEKLSRTARERGVALVIVHPPGTELRPDGTLGLSRDEAALAQFRRLCVAHGIRFLDMGPRFLAEYARNRVLPRG